jgi:ssDNA-binding Zn-finger/Zn-ribbon topoisomerase 1
MILHWLSPWRIPSHLPIDQVMRKRIVQRARILERTSPHWRANAMFDSLLMGGWLLLMFTASPLLRHFGLDWMTLLTLPLLFGGIFVISWLVIRARGSMACNQALREYGFDVCPRCEYWLRGLHEDVRQCPECGAAREPLTEKSP